MSQHDFNIANQGFSATRADLNNAFGALATNSSGATAPATTYAYQWWYDSTANILKIRNADNDAWISFAFFNQSNDTWTIQQDANGNVGIGGAPNAATILDLVSTTKGFRAPSMTTVQRDAISSPVAGLLIYNTTLNSYQVYNGTSWTSVGGGATGGGSNQIFIENDQTVTTSYTITAGKNAGTFGPVSIDSGITVTVPSGSVWSIV